MKYLFFDIECASVYKGSKICSFGYVLTDENLNIIESDDIIVNPKCEWDFYALKHILAHNKEYYESYPSFDKQYDRIKRLFEGDVIALGHGVSNDVRFLNDDCARYKLPCINFKFYDGAGIYKEYGNDKEIKSLAKVSALLSSHTQGEKHESKEDAFLVYEYIKKICESMGTTIDELLKLVPRCKGENKKGIYSVYGETKSKEKTRKNKGKLYEYFIKYVKPDNENYIDIFKGKKIAISSNYEKNNFKRMMYIIQLIANCNGRYVVDPKDTNLYVKFDIIDDKGRKEYCDKDYVIHEAIDEGKQIEIIDINQFLSLIGYDERNVEKEFNRIKEETVKILKKEEVKKTKVKSL